MNTQEFTFQKKVQDEDKHYYDVSFEECKDSQKTEA